MGFVEACNSYDKNKGVPFVAYASTMMNWQISNSLRNRKAMVKFPYYFEDVWKVASKNYFGYNKEDMEKLVSMTTYTYEQVENAMRWYYYNSPAYLDSEQEDGSNLYEMVLGDTFDDTTANVSEYLSSLTDKQKSVVTLLMDGKTQTEIATELGVSQQHVSRIVKSLQKAWLDKYE